MYVFVSPVGIIPFFLLFEKQQFPLSPLNPFSGEREMCTSLSLQSGSKLDPCARYFTALSGTPFPLLGPQPICTKPCRSLLEWGSSHSVCCTGHPHSSSHCRVAGRKGQCCSKLHTCWHCAKAPVEAHQDPHTRRYKIWLSASGAMPGSLRVFLHTILACRGGRVGRKGGKASPGSSIDTGGLP